MLLFKKSKIVIKKTDRGADDDKFPEISALKFLKALGSGARVENRSEIGRGPLFPLKGGPTPVQPVRLPVSRGKTGRRKKKGRCVGGDLVFGKSNHFPKNTPASSPFWVQVGCIIRGETMKSTTKTTPVYRKKEARGSHRKSWSKQEGGGIHIWGE